MDKKDISKIVNESFRKTLEANGVKPSTEQATKAESVSKPLPKLIKEAVILTPKAFVLKTEYQSTTTKENHFKLYKNYVDSFNKISSKLDTVDKVQEPNNASNSEFRRLKLDEQSNLNAVKLHELYFDNISDLASNIGMDSIPFMRLARDWGSFENWQFDFRATAMAATEGWAILYWEPFKQRYLNCFVEKHTDGIPVGGIPVFVVDTFHHAWFRDYPDSPDGKINYLNASLREANWNVVEARMIIAERSNVQQIFMIKPAESVNPGSLPNQVRIANAPPIDKSQVTTKIGD
jgi:Fe-Mn family superoxide dismutase